MNELESAILKTLVYFDIFAYPLTAWEIWKWLYGQKAEFFEVEKALQNSQALRGQLEMTSGFYHLASRGGTVRSRQDRYELALQKFQIAQPFIKKLSRLPYVKFVAICNSLGLFNAQGPSDIDLFIVVKPGHIWTARLLAAGYAKLRKLRPTQKFRQNKFCLSFYLTEDALNVQPLLFPVDPYFAFWLATLVPVFDPEKILERLYASNAWLFQILPNLLPRNIARQREIARSNLQTLGEKFFNFGFWEKLAEKLEQKWLPSNLKKLANLDSRVVLNDQVLKFHDNDRRQEYARLFQAKLQTLGLNV
ncbi:hypothetical protein C4546_05160 [Candidatus Parcubacteria bacterium]|jgi:hypothetical protein|nr:MAG: hypothetical protein C4546_05160 [Candidatus Parcubacteria bacterium]